MPSSSSFSLQKRLSKQSDPATASLAARAPGASHDETVLKRTIKSLRSIVLEVRQLGDLGSTVTGVVSGLANTASCTLDGTCDTPAPAQNSPVAAAPVVAQPQATTTRRVVTQAAPVAQTTPQQVAPTPAFTPPVQQQPATTAAPVQNAPVATAAPVVAAQSQQNVNAAPVAQTTAAPVAQAANGGNAAAPATAANNGAGNAAGTTTAAVVPNRATILVSSITNGQLVVSTATLVGAAALASESSLARVASVLENGGTITSVNAAGQTVTLSGPSAASAAASSLSSLLAGAGSTTAAPVAAGTNAAATGTDTTAAAASSSSGTSSAGTIGSPVSERVSNKSTVGIAVGVVVGALVLAGFIFVVVRRRRRKNAAVPVSNKSQFYTDRPASPQFTSFPVTFGSNSNPNVARPPASSLGRHGSFGSSFREQFMPTQRASDGYTSTHPYGNYAAVSALGAAEGQTAAHYSSAPLLDVPITLPTAAFNSWQSASMPTFGNLTRLSGESTTAGVLRDHDDDDSDDSGDYDREQDSPMMASGGDPFSSERDLAQSREDVYLQARSGSESVGQYTGGQARAHSSLSVNPSVYGQAHSPSDGFSIDSFETARGTKRDSDYSTYSQSSDDHDHTATYHVGVEGARATLLDRRAVDPFRDSVSSARTTASDATAIPYASSSTPTAAYLVPRVPANPVALRTQLSRASNDTRTHSAISYDSTGSSILNFQADFPPSSPERRP